MSNDFQPKTIVLRELEPMLQKKFGDELIVESYTTESLLPPGENYGSTILGVHAVIRKTADAEKEDLHLIAKMSPPTEFQRRVFDSPYTFGKETAMYETILPGYNELERECGLKEDETFHILPQFYGTRLSLDPNGEFDDDAAILLENLKIQGYYVGSRSDGYDLEHSKLAVRAMARFHGLGMAMKQKKPEVFEIYKKFSKCVDIKGEEFPKMHMLMLQKISEDPALVPHYDKCAKILTAEGVLNAFTSVPTEPWTTIIHADFWVNNIMFHKAEDGKVDDIKFVDFQNYLFSSPLRELVFYIFSSIDNDTHENHIDELIEVYRETLIDVLTTMDCDTGILSKESLNAQLKVDANLEFLHLCFMLKVLTLDAKESNIDLGKIKSVMTGYDTNQLCIERLRRLVIYFADHNWI